MACEFLRGLLEPRCAARDELPVPNMVEEVSYCLGGSERRCPFFIRACREGRNPPPPDAVGRMGDVYGL